MLTHQAYGRCPRCKSPDVYTPGEACLHCEYVEKNPQIIEMTKTAPLKIPRAALLRCPKCKTTDIYTPGEKCLACNYLEKDPKISKLGKELRYRIIPLIKSYDFCETLKTRKGTRSRGKYDPIAGALLEYEYAFTLLFNDRTLQIKALQNLYRILSNLDTALDKVLVKNKSVNDHNRNLLNKIKSSTQLNSSSGLLSKSLIKKIGHYKK